MHAANEAFAEILFSPEGRADPYSRYRRLREAVPVHHSAMGIWALTRFDDVNDTLRSRQVGKDVRRFMAGRFSGDWEQHPALRKLAAAMLWADPPEHTRLRRIVNRVFTTKRVEEHRAAIRRRTEELIAPIAEAGGGDICNELCFPLPLGVVAGLIGIPLDEAPILREPIRDFQRTFELGMTATELRRADEAAEFLDGYYGELVRQKTRQPGDDLLSALIGVRDGDDKLSFDELVQMCHMIVAAGSETTTYFLTNGIRLFAEHPDQADRVRADPSLLDPAIDEVLRYDPPAHMVPRTTSEAVRIGGVELPAGARIMALIAAANRDPAKFTDPDAFDVTRRQGPSISFGAGIHVCPGWRLARLQAEVVFPVVLHRLDGLEIAAPLRHRARVAFPQVEELRVRFRGYRTEAT
ncbi:Cytochrome P450 [Frankia canadensis]|uniref:Cytochrome P450 n=1 Tax=Frankia canadensis TaxID=1836972 RepID=A0A2I2KS45_9ACTN|nr:Cytochrome P450 [Frankia canadensis]SOU55781.1 Cytochrome P450 [Frankia canadensis]